MKTNCWIFTLVIRIKEVLDGVKSGQHCFVSGQIIQDPVKFFRIWSSWSRIRSNCTVSGQTAKESVKFSGFQIAPVKLGPHPVKLFPSNWVHIRSNCSRQVGSTSGQIVLRTGQIVLHPCSHCSGFRIRSN